MWRGPLLACCIVVSGCVGAVPSGGPRFSTDAQTSPGQDTTLHRVIGPDMWDQPLLPQPGNIWADVLPRGDAADSAAAMVKPNGSREAPTAAVMPRAKQRARVVTAQSGAGPASTGPAAGKGKDVAALPGVLDAGDRPMVQLAAVADAKRAEAAWRRLRQEAPRLTVGHDPSITSADVNDRHIWRLRAGGFQDIAAARAFCSGVRAVKSDCWVVPALAVR